MEDWHFTIVNVFTRHLSKLDIRERTSRMHIVDTYSYTEL